MKFAIYFVISCKVSSSAYSMYNCTCILICLLLSEGSLVVTAFCFNKVLHPRVNRSDFSVSWSFFLPSRGRDQSISRETENFENFEFHHAKLIIIIIIIIYNITNISQIWIYAPTKKLPIILFMFSNFFIESLNAFLF